MHEIIHLSLGTTANHTHSHFYNSQASYFVYTEEDTKRSYVDPNVLFRSGKSFTPRGLIWDMKGGYGSLSRTNAVYKDDAGENTDIWNQTGAMEVIKEKPVKKTPYRKWVEGNGQSAQLDAANTLYWSDYLNIIYHPKSMLTIPNWTYDPVKYPHGKHKGVSDTELSSPEHSFTGYQTGLSEWDDMNGDREYLEHHFRPIIEQCDSLSGISLVTETDSAWSGVSASILQEIRDDYFSRGSIFTWSISDPASFKKPSANSSCIRALVDLSQNSTLYLPLSPAEDVNTSSNWYNAAIYNIVFESYSTLSSLRGKKRISMDAIASSLTGGSGRNIVDQLSAWSPSTLWNTSGILQSKTPGHVFSVSSVKRPPLVEATKAPVSNFGLVDTRDPWALYNSGNVSEEQANNRPKSGFSKEKLAEAGTMEYAITEYDSPQSFNLLPTFPVGMVSETDEISASLQITTNVRTSLNEMQGFAQRIFKGDEREEIVQLLGNMAEEYENGYSDDEDYD